MPTSNERKMLSSNEALKELKAGCILQQLCKVPPELLFTFVVHNAWIWSQG